MITIAAMENETKNITEMRLWKYKPPSAWIKASIPQAAATDAGAELKVPDRESRTLEEVHS